MGFDDFAEAQFTPFLCGDDRTTGLPPVIYFRLLLIGYFEGIDSERGSTFSRARSISSSIWRSAVSQSSIAVPCWPPLAA
jgi:hypothetical protein